MLNLTSSPPTMANDNDRTTACLDCLSTPTSARPHGNTSKSSPNFDPVAFSAYIQVAEVASRITPRLKNLIHLCPAHVPSDFPIETVDLLHDLLSHLRYAEDRLDDLGVTDLTRSLESVVKTSPVPTSSAAGVWKGKEPVQGSTYDIMLPLPDTRPVPCEYTPKPAMYWVPTSDCPSTPPSEQQRHASGNSLGQDHEPVLEGTVGGTYEMDDVVPAPMLTISHPVSDMDSAMIQMSKSTTALNAIDYINIPTTPESLVSTVAPRSEREASENSQVNGFRERPAGDDFHAFIPAKIGSKELDPKVDTSTWHERSCLHRLNTALTIPASKRRTHTSSSSSLDLTRSDAAPGGSRPSHPAYRVRKISASGLRPAGGKSKHERNWQSTAERSNLLKILYANGDLELANTIRGLF